MSLENCEPGGEKKPPTIDSLRAEIARLLSERVSLSASLAAGKGIKDRNSEGRWPQPDLIERDLKFVRDRKGALDRIDGELIKARDGLLKLVNIALNNPDDKPKSLEKALCYFGASDDVIRALVKGYKRRKEFVNELIGQDIVTDSVGIEIQQVLPPQLKIDEGRLQVVVLAGISFDGKDPEAVAISVVDYTKPKSD